MEDWVPVGKVEVPFHGRVVPACPVWMPGRLQVAATQAKPGQAGLSDHMHGYVAQY